MTQQLIRFLRWLLAWLDPPPQSVIVLPVPIDALLEQARALTQAQQRDYPDRSGESKRHQVYSALTKAFPGRTHRQIARAIEAALI